MKLTLTVIQVVSAILAAGLIILQSRGVGLSATFGGGGGEFYRSKRGLEKVLFFLTIITALTFSSLTILLSVVK